LAQQRGELFEKGDGGRQIRPQIYL